MKQLTVRIDLEQYGAKVPVPDEPGPDREAALNHNRAVVLLRRLEAATLAAQCEQLGVACHVGRYAVLIRGPEPRIEKIEVPAVTRIKDASERWRGFRHASE